MVEIDKDQFGKFVSDNSVCVIDFYAAWCGPCKVLAPKLTAWAEKYKVPAGKVNVSDNMDLAASFNVNLLPTVIIFKNGKEYKRIIGLFSETEFKKSLE